MALVAMTALASLLVEYGFKVPAPMAGYLALLDYALAAVFGLNLALILKRSPGRLNELRTRWIEFALFTAFVVGAGVLFLAGTEENLEGFLSVIHMRSVAKLLLALVQIFLFVNVTLRGLEFQEKYISSKIPAEYLLVGSFAALILIGSLLLSLPRATAAGVAPLSFMDAFFTATSAACVTGLSVRDVGTEFSVLGQWVVLGLFQVGGLGIITFVAFGSVLATKKFSIPQTVALRDLTNSGNLTEGRRFVWQVVLWMLLIELAGALALFSMAPAGDLDFIQRAFWAVFHSVSAFCNAGFSLQSDSFESMGGSVGINLTIMGLIVLGGLGMPVSRELIRYKLTRSPFFRRFDYFKRAHQGKAHKRLSLQTRISLWMTLILILVGGIGFLALESGGVFSDCSIGGKLLSASFQSVTTRTAGFNSVSFGDLGDATLVLVIGLMAIGAGPVSTGGGIKTVTFAVLLASTRAMITGRHNVEVMGRTLPRVLVRGALSVFVLYVMTAGITVFLLSITDPGIALRDKLFETISALSTVGLSTGVTGDFSTGGRIVLCLTMFIGRVGPMALIFSVFRSRRSAEEYQFPEEELVVG